MNKLQCEFLSQASIMHSVSVDVRSQVHVDQHWLSTLIHPAEIERVDACTSRQHLQSILQPATWCIVLECLRKIIFSFCNPSIPKTGWR